MFFTPLERKTSIMKDGRGGEGGQKMTLSTVLKDGKLCFAKTLMNCIDLFINP